MISNDLDNNEWMMTMWINLQLHHADPEIALIELVLYVPPEGSERLPLLHDGVEEAQREQQPAPVLGPRARDVELRVADRIRDVRAVDVIFEAFRSLIRHLYTWKC